MRLRDYAKREGISYLTAYRWWRAGQLQGRQTPTGMILIDDPRTPAGRPGNRAIIYARVSSSDSRQNAQTQAERLQQWAVASGNIIIDQVIETASGLDDQRPKLHRLMRRDDWDLLVVEHRDRLTRFGFAYLEGWAESAGRKIVVVNQVEPEGGDADLAQDFVAIITSMCQRIYGRRRAARKTERLVAELQDSKIVVALQDTGQRSDCT